MTYLPTKSYINHGLTYAAPNGYTVTGSARTSTLATIYITRFYAPEDITVNSISVNCQTGVAGATLSLGIYNAALPAVAQAFTIVGGSTTPYPSGLSASATGRVTGTLSSSVSLTAGSTYYFGVLATTAAPTLSAYSVASATSWYGVGTGQFISARSVTMSSVVTGATNPGSGTTYVYTTSSTHAFGVGASVTVAGASIAAYNGTFTVTSFTSNTFTVTGGTSNPGTPAFTSNGTVVIASIPPTFTGNSIYEVAAGNGGPSSGLSMHFTIN